MYNYFIVQREFSLFNLNSSLFQKKSRVFFIFLLLGILIIPFIYHFTFIADDLIILKAAQLHSFPFLSDWEYSSTGMYRPLIILSYYLNYKIFGYNPFPYYLFNILLHVFNSYLVFLLFCQLLKIVNYKTYILLSFFAGLIFFILPQNIMNIMWIPGRNDILAGTFTFSSLYFFVIYVNSKKNYFLIFTILFGIFAYASKETALLLNIYMLLILGFFFLQNNKVPYKKIILPYLILTVIYFFFRFLIFGKQLFGDSKLINPNIFNIMKFIFYGFWCLWFPIDLLDVYYFFIKCSLWFFIIVIPLVIVIAFLVYGLLQKNKNRNLKLGFFTLLLSIVSLFIYTGNYPQMRLMYIHLPLVIMSLILIIKEINISSKKKFLFLISYFFLISFGFYAVLFRSEKINNYYSEIYKVIEKTKVIRDSQFLFCPTLGRMGQSWVNPAIEFISNLILYNDLTMHTKNYYKILSYDTYSFTDYRNIIEYKILNSNQFILKIKNDEGVIVPEASKSFRKNEERYFINNYLPGITVFPLDSKNYREGKPNGCLVNINSNINRKNTYIIIWEKNHLIIQSLENFFKE